MSMGVGGKVGSFGGKGWWVIVLLKFVGPKEKKLCARELRREVKIMYLVVKRETEKRKWELMLMRERMLILSHLESWLNRCGYVDLKNICLPIKGFL